MLDAASLASPNSELHLRAAFQEPSQALAISNPREKDSEALEGLQSSLLTKRWFLEVQHRSEHLRLVLLEVSKGRGSAESGSWQIT